ncbi:MAG: hypothetical protein MI802_12035, partial [Desulfobacterales bacterium]|nr:hypothetical protein [Desulfobacterales bacterium]
MIEIVPLLKGLSPIFLLFLTLALIYGSVRQRIAAVTGSISGRFLGLITGGIIHGLCFGLTAVISMSMGLHLSPGVSVDGRLLMISLSGAYGGVISGIITAGVATVYRLSMDGNALAASLTGILGSLIIGIVFFRQ